jgi:uncharacterized protein (TIGR02001 family)
MGKKLIWVAAASMALAQGAHAEWSGSLTVTSDYDFRGISQTGGDLAIQPSLDFSSGLFYASLWGSNVDFGSDVDGTLEVDLVAGLAGEIGDDWRWDVGATYYLYPGSSDDPDAGEEELPDYYEIYAGGGWGPVDVMLWFSDDYLDSGDDGWYFEGSAAFPLPFWELELGLHAGWSFGDFYDSLESPGGDDAEYADYSVGISRPFGNFTGELKFVTTDTESEFDVERGAGENDSRFILSISTTFPWGDE